MDFLPYGSRGLATVAAILSAILFSGCKGNAIQTASPTDACTQHIAVPARLPKLIAHRGSTADFPENTLLAIKSALANGADAIWLTVQLSRDGVPVLYRPQDLATLTNAHGPVAALTAAELAQVNAVILDMKALPAGPQADAVARVLEAEQAWSRVILYSTEAAYQQAFSHYPAARSFESRDATRQRIFAVALRNRCDAPPPHGAYAGFEMMRKVEIVERFTLGEGRSTINAKTWTPASVQCFRKNGNAQLIGFAVNDAKAYRTAACLGLDSVLVDSPATMRHVKAAISTGLNCGHQLLK